MFIKISKPGCQYFGIHLPVGVVYATLPETIVHGKHFMPKCVYVDDFNAVKTRQHFIVYEIKVNGYPPRPVYVDGTKGYAAQIKRYILANFDNLPRPKATILNRDIDAMGPKDRKVGAYIQKPRKSKNDNPNAMTGDLVTNGCRIGPRTYSNEMYEYVRMGVR